MVEMQGVRVKKGEYILLSELDWRVQQGQIWAVKGANGSGKSTTVRLIMVRAMRAWGGWAWLRFEKKGWENK